ncbi:MAG TPA: Spy/CpxP family protein refolding chaperone [Blastocatellia bacterium]|nr:Spy/CpxP family protein refolding chaperone [Blastocatellia bacterium]
MKTHSIAPVLISTAILLSFAAASASAQIRSNPNRPLKGERRIDGDGQFYSQLGRRKNRLPGDQRGMNVPPLGGRPKLNQNQKAQVQRMVMQAIGLTPDQHARIKEIHLSHDDERIASGRRLRQARQALDRAVMNERYDEASVRRATEELIAAQADKIRLESRIRSEVRNVLTSDQVIRFHQFERDFRRQMRQQQLEQRQQMLEEKQTENTRPPQEFDELDLMSMLFSEG